MNNIKNGQSAAEVSEMDLIVRYKVQRLIVEDSKPIILTRACGILI